MTTGRFAPKAAEWPGMGLGTPPREGDGRELRDGDGREATPEIEAPSSMRSFGTSAHWNVGTSSMFPEPRIHLN